MILVPTEIFFISDYHYHSTLTAQSLMAYKDSFGGPFEKWNLFLMKSVACMKIEKVCIVLGILFQMLQILPLGSLPDYCKNW